MPRLTKRVVDSLACTGDAPALLWDDSLAGFGVKALPSGSKRYVVKYRANGGGRSATQRWVTLGSHGKLTCDQARDLAQQILAAVARGVDPQSDKFQRRDAPKFENVWQKFETDYLPLRKPQTRSEYQNQWRDIIAPRLGTVPVADITQFDIDKLHKGLRDTPYRANRTLALCSRLMTLAEKWGWRGQSTNPCRYVERFKEQPRNRYLKVIDLQKLGNALNALEEGGEIQPGAATAVKLLLLTGARLNELLTAKWAWIDWDSKFIALPDSKTGEKPIYLSELALDLLRVQQQAAAVANSEYIFPGRSIGKHMVNLRKPWVRVCRRAGIDGVRLHDLRHTAASIAVGQGASLPVIGRLLGHSQAQTTLRYAHVDIDPALAAANKIGSVIEAAFEASLHGE